MREPTRKEKLLKADGHKTMSQIMREEDARAKLRRSAAGRLAMICKPVGLSDCKVEVKPVRRMTRDEWIAAMTKKLRRPELLEIMGRTVSSGGRKKSYLRDKKEDLIYRIIFEVTFRCSYTKTGLDAACAIPEDLMSVGTFCWVLNPSCA
jgi:hypothetical protein